MQSLVQSVGEVINNGPGPVPVQQLLDRMVMATRGQGGTIHLWQSDVLALAAWTPNIPEPVLKAVRTVPIGKGMAGVAAQRREPVFTCDLQVDNAGGVARPDARKTGFRGSICVPMISQGGALVGTLGIGSADTREFTEGEVRELMEAAGAAADAILSRGHVR
jgi:GAF domain-containing protein